MKRWEMKGKMDAKKLTGALVAVVLAVPILVNATPATLAVIEVGLIGVLYAIRRRRVTGGRYGFV